MNAPKARKKRRGSTLLERTMHDPTRAARIEQLTAAADIEQLAENRLGRRAHQWRQATRS